MRVERAITVDGGAFDAADIVVLELEADVLGHALRAEWVGAFAPFTESLAGNRRHRLDADLAGELVLFFHSQLYGCYSVRLRII